MAAPTLWTDIRVMQHDTGGALEGPRIYLERSGTCPIFLTWFSYVEPSGSDFQDVIDDLIIPGAERWQRITVIAGEDYTSEIFLDAIEHLNFPILQDIEVSSMLLELTPSNRALCHSAPLLRRCRLRGVPSLPPPSNLVVLDYMFSALAFTDFNLDPLLEFLPHVAHSLEHLRFAPPPVSKVQFTPRTSKITLEHLKSLLIRDSHTIMDHILTPSLAHFVILCPLGQEKMDPSVFEGFSAPMLRSIQFYGVPLLPTLEVHNFPSMFPHLNSFTLSGCTDESAFALLLEPPEPKKPSSLQKASKYPPKHRKVQNPFPSLKELTVSDTTSWTTFQAAIEKRLKNGDKTLRKIQLPEAETAAVILSHLRRWLPAHGIELALYEPGELPVAALEFQDDFCNDETDLFLAIVELNEWTRYQEDGMDPDQEWDYDGYEDEDEDENFDWELDPELYSDEDENENENEYEGGVDDFYDG